MERARGWHRSLPWMTVFAIAMAFLESAVVVDLRALYYPEPSSFPFPIAPLDRRIALTELFREVATMVMLLAPGAMITRRALERFAWFLYGFGVWDLFYYVFLKAILDWPSSLLDWDILFLVPVPWVGPVLAPCIVAFGMIAFALLILWARDRDPDVRLDPWAWAPLGLSVVLMLFAMVEAPLSEALEQRGGVYGIALSGDAHMLLRGLAPDRFQWPVFLAGAALGGGTLVQLSRRWRKARVASDSRRQH